MFDSLSEVWIGIIVAAIVLFAVGRWVYYKVTGKEVSDASDILGELRTKITQIISESINLIELEKSGGRDAVKAEITTQLEAIINAATILTDAEKTIILSLDVGKVVDFIVTELIQLGILSSE